MIDLYNWDKYIKGKLAKKGVPEHDLEDYMQDVYLSIHKNKRFCESDCVVPFIDLQIHSVLTESAKKWKAEKRQGDTVSFDVAISPYLDKENLESDSIYPLTLVVNCNKFNSRYIDELKRLASNELNGYWLGSSDIELTNAYRKRQGSVRTQAKEFLNSEEI
jgi:hypothetical protein